MERPPEPARLRVGGVPEAVRLIGDDPVLGDGCGDVPALPLGVKFNEVLVLEIAIGSFFSGV